MIVIHLNLIRLCLLRCGSVVLAMGLAAECLASAPPTSHHKYNVLMIIIDDAAPQLHGVRQDGPVRTPNIERLASRGTWFKQPTATRQRVIRRAWRCSAASEPRARACTTIPRSFPDLDRRG